MDLLAFLDVHSPHIVSIQETKIDSLIATSELFPDSRIHVYTTYLGRTENFMVADIPHMPLSELENNSESVCVKVLANKNSHYLVSWYRPPGGSSEDFQLFRDQLDQIRNKHKSNKLPSVHILGHFTFKDIAWPDRVFICDLFVSLDDPLMS